MQLNFLRLPCATQYIKIRDGPSLSSTLLIEMQGGTTGVGGVGGGGGGSGGGGGGNAYSGNLPVSLESSGAQLLLEFYAGEEANIANNTDIHTGLICTGGFLANVEQIGKFCCFRVCSDADNHDIFNNCFSSGFLAFLCFFS